MCVELAVNLCAQVARHYGVAPVVFDDLRRRWLGLGLGRADPARLRMVLFVEDGRLGAMGGSDITRGAAARREREGLPTRVYSAYSGSVLEAKF